MVSVVGWAEFVRRTPVFKYTANFHFAHNPYRARDQYILERDCRNEGVLQASRRAFVVLTGFFNGRMNHK